MTTPHPPAAPGDPCADAWLAGVLSVVGEVWISKAHPPTAHAPNYIAGVTVRRVVDNPTILRIHALAGVGHVIERKTARRLIWQAQSRQAVAILTRLLPWFVGGIRERSALILALGQEIARAGGRPSLDQIAAREALYQRLRAMENPQ
jgi:hypothetical protein